MGFKNQQPSCLADTKKHNDALERWEALSSQPWITQGAKRTTSLVGFFARESNFLFQLTLIFLVSMASVPTAKLLMQRQDTSSPATSLRTYHLKPEAKVRTAKATTPSRPTQPKTTLVQLATQPKPVVRSVSKVTPVANRRAYTGVRYVSAMQRRMPVQQAKVSLPARKALYTKNRVAAYHHPLSIAQPDSALSATRVVLHREYRVTRPPAYPEAMSWVKQTLKSYQEKKS